MALGNWDTLAVDENGKPITGVLVSHAGVKVVIYKNWVYVEDPAAYRENDEYSRQTVMDIQHGNLIYKDVHIHVDRDDRDDCYVVAWTSRWDSDTNTRVDKKALAGVGCYGFAIGEEEYAKCEDRKWPWLGIQPRHVERLLKMLQEFGHDAYPVEDLPIFQEDFKLDEALQYNQGDAYFAKHLGKEIPAREVPAQGEASDRPA